MSVHLEDNLQIISQPYQTGDKRNGINQKTLETFGIQDSEITEQNWPSGSAFYLTCRRLVLHLRGSQTPSW